jgi:hypothetical protein
MYVDGNRTARAGVLMAGRTERRGTSERAPMRRRRRRRSRDRSLSPLASGERRRCVGEAGEERRGSRLGWVFWVRAGGTGPPLDFLHSPGAIRAGCGHLPYGPNEVA